MFFKKNCVSDIFIINILQVTYFDIGMHYEDYKLQQNKQIINFSYTFLSEEICHYWASLIAATSAKLMHLAGYTATYDWR